MSNISASLPEGYENRPDLFDEEGNWDGEVGDLTLEDRILGFLDDPDGSDFTDDSDVPNGENL